jgi:GntR family transcriptional regulator
MRPMATTRGASAGTPPAFAAGIRSIAPDAAGMPLFRAVRSALLQAIDAGTAAPGEALPSETELAASFGVSVGTLRRAVDELVTEHILVRRQGRGTFVATHTSDRFLFQYFHVERADGLRELPTVELLAFERTRLDTAAAEALARPEGEAAFELHNRLLLQSRPVVHDRLVLPAALFKGLSEKRLRERPSTIYHLYQSAFGITVARAHERLRAVAADRTVARVLGVAPGSPVLQVRRTAIALGGQAVEFRVSTVHTRDHEYVNLLSRAG